LLLAGCKSARFSCLSCQRGLPVCCLPAFPVVSFLPSAVSSQQSAVSSQQSRHKSKSNSAEDPNEIQQKKNNNKNTKKKAAQNKANPKAQVHSHRKASGISDLESLRV